MKFRQIRSATSILTYAGTRFLIDPFLADKGALPPVPQRENTNGNPLVDLPCSIEEILEVDAVFVTHIDHFDHFDEVAKQRIPKDMPMLAASPREAQDMKALGFKNVTVITEAGIDYKGITIHRTDALHGSGVRAAHYYKKHGTTPDACGAVFKHKDEKTIYFAGDTIWFDGVEKALTTHQPDVVVLNAANAQFYDGTPILMAPDSVEDVANTVPNATLIASHMDAVNHAHTTRADLRAYAEQAGFINRLLIPADGETIQI